MNSATGSSPDRPRGASLAEVDHVDTVIVGGGVAGLACARELAAAGRRFLLVTDRLGGRVHCHPDDGLNFGASYITSDYRRMRRFVDRGPRIWMKDVFFRDGARLVTIFDPATVARIPALARLYRELARFRSRLNAMRQLAPEVCQKELMQADPVLCRATREPAPELVARLGLEDLDAVYVNPIVRSTLFVPADEVNAFYYLAVLFPILLGTWAADCRDTVRRMTAGIEDRIVLDTVGRCQRLHDGRFRIETAGDGISADHLVVATPPRNTHRFFPEIIEPSDGPAVTVPVTTLHVWGRRKEAFRPERTVFLHPDEHDVTVLWPQHNGADILFAHDGGRDLPRYYDHVDRVRSVRWNTAIVLSGAEWRPLNPEPNLYTVGDHNVCGLEDASLTGVFAARRIIRGGA